MLGVGCVCGVQLDNIIKWNIIEVCSVLSVTCARAY